MSPTVTEVPRPGGSSSSRATSTNATMAASQVRLRRRKRGRIGLPHGEDVPVRIFHHRIPGRLGNRRLGADQLAAEGLKTTESLVERVDLNVVDPTPRPRDGAMHHST